MIGDAITIGLLAVIIYNTWKLIEQISELKDAYNKMAIRLAINEIHRNTAPIRNKNQHGFTADEWYRNTFKDGEAE